MVISAFSHKLTVEDIVVKISEICSKSDKDKWFLDIQDGCQRFLEDHKKNRNKIGLLSFTEDFGNLDHKNQLRTICWMMIWLTQIYVKIDFLCDLCLIFSKIWKIIEDTKLEVQDLDNKIVWRNIVRECEDMIQDSVFFRDNKKMLSNLVQKVCEFLGSAADEPDAV